MTELVEEINGQYIKKQKLKKIRIGKPVNYTIKASLFYYRKGD